MKCKICEQDKPETEFYASQKGNRCKDCHKRKVRENRAANLDKYRAYDKERFAADPSVRARQARYAATESGRSAHSRAVQKFIANNPEKRAAHVLLNNAVKSGKITKPKACPRCGRTCRIHGHHADYSKPLEVEWMCPRCHKAEHQ